VVVAVRPGAEAALSGAARAAGVAACRLGVAGGDRLQIALGESHLEAGLDQLRAAWSSPF
jgi:hypothetical protein